MSGTFMTTSPLQVLGDLGKQGATGVLTIEGANRTTKISLRNGRIYHCAEQPPRANYLLGNLLIHLKADPRKVNEASIQGRDSGVPIGQLLLDGRAIEEIQLSRALVTQLKTRVGTFDGWETGNYEFSAGVPSAPIAHAPTVAPVRLLFLGRLDMYARQPSRSQTKEEAPFGSHYVAPVQSNSKWVAKLGFNRHQLQLWSAVAAARYRLHDIYGHTEMEQAEGYATLFALRDLGMLSFSEQLDRAARLEMLVERFESKNAAIRGGNLFDVLEAHWTSDTAGVKAGYERVRELYDASLVEDAPDEIILPSQTIIAYIESAYETLRDTKARRDYRESIVDDATIRQTAELMIRQADLGAFKEDYVDAKARYSQALELIPGNREIQEKMTAIAGLERRVKQRGSDKK